MSRSIYRLEKREGALELKDVKIKEPIILIAGSEGQGIHLPIKSTSIYIKTDDRLESLNVAQALSIALYNFSQAYATSST